jgi:alkaline phosphatase isozyme conversion protein
MRTLQVRNPIWLVIRLVICLLVLPACAWLTGIDGKATPVATGPAIFGQATQAANLPTALPVQATQMSAPAPLPTVLLTQTQAEVIPAAVVGKALKHIQALSEEIGPRPPGTNQEKNAAVYIENVFKSLGYQTSLQPFSFPSDNTSVHSANVVAEKSGQSARIIIVGAHYDSVEVGKGADDNASGVAVMLAVAEMVKDLQTPYSIRFVAFGAEEAGLYGSNYFVQRMSAAEIQNTVTMINLDSLIAGNTPNVYGDSNPQGTLRNWLLEYAQNQGLELQTQPVENLDYPDGSSCNCADFSEFQAAGIPFAYFEATDWTLGDKDGWTQVDPQYGKNGQIWNSRYDYLDYINQNFPGRMEQHLELFIQLVYAALRQYQAPQ